ncbi:alpha/beta hydrolase [Parapusillimonas sp. SGNA-6]|nr:alpha/beta hydrolase [Parapusillimonas sp. SGNA-6]
MAREMVRLASARARALVLIATSARPDSPVQAQRKVDTVCHLAATGFGGLSRAAVLASLHISRSSDRELVERVQSMSVRLGADVFSRQAAVRRDGDMDNLSRIHCPTLVVAADGDRLRSLEEPRELAERILNAELGKLAA